jgi:hypothetical protein
MQKESSDSSSNNDSGENLSIYRAMVPRPELNANAVRLKNAVRLSKNSSRNSISEHSLSNESQLEILKIGDMSKRKTQGKRQPTRIVAGSRPLALESPPSLRSQKSLTELKGIFQPGNVPPAPKLYQQVVSLAHIPETDTNRFPGYSVREIVQSKVDLRFNESTVDTVHFSSLLKSKDSLILFSPLYETTLKIFLGYPLGQQDLELDEYSRLILNDILKRKFGKGLRKCDLAAGKGQMLPALAKLLRRDTAKRPEECYKFIFTRLLKHLKRKFRKSMNKSMEEESMDSRMQIESENDLLDEQFHLHYFEQTAIEKGLDWTRFKYLACAGKKGKEGVSILSTEFFELVFASGPFLLDSLNYLQGDFIGEYRQDVARKLLALVGHWDRELGKLRSKRQAKYLEIKQYLSKNKHCKLPWTVGEAEKAVRRVFCLVDAVINDGLKELRITTLNSN